MLALETVASMCIDHDKSLEIVMPRSLTGDTHSSCRPSRVLGPEGCFFLRDSQQFTFGTVEIHLPVLTPLVQTVKVLLEKHASTRVVYSSIEFRVIRKEGDGRVRADVVRSIIYIDQKHDRAKN